MSELSREPTSLRWLSRLLLRLGLWRSTVAVTALVALASLAIVNGLIGITGAGDRAMASAVAAACAMLLTPPIAGALLRLLFELERTRSQLTVLSTQDELTGVSSRRHFMLIAEREMARCRRYDTDGAVLLIDADHFKRVNDSHGHLCGDALLREIARATARSLRQPDLLARFAGEELVAFLPHTDPLGALDVAERVRERIGSLRLAWQGRAVGTTVSIGVAALGSGHATLDALIHDADGALNAAKEAGRNCVRAAPIQPRRSGETRHVHSR